VDYSIAKNGSQAEKEALSNPLRVICLITCLGFRLTLSEYNDKQNL
jgi:hypothetical protein